MSKPIAFASGDQVEPTAREWHSWLKPDGSHCIGETQRVAKCSSPSMTTVSVISRHPISRKSGNISSACALWDLNVRCQLSNALREI